MRWGCGGWAVGWWKSVGRQYEGGRCSTGSETHEEVKESDSLIATTVNQLRFTSLVADLERPTFFGKSGCTPSMPLSISTSAMLGRRG